MDGTRGNYRRTARRGATCLGALFVAAFTSFPAHAGSPPKSPPRARFGLPVQLALRRAVKKLAHPECQLVYADFRDPRGKTLQEGLIERGESGAAHLLGVVFEDGDRMPPCRRGRILAYTSPGSGTVRLCTAHFAQALRDDAEVAVATLIHEQLHTLGLLENPPTSREITVFFRRFFARRVGRRPE